MGLDGAGRTVAGHTVTGLPGTEFTVPVHTVKGGAAPGRHGIGRPGAEFTVPGRIVTGRPIARL